MKPPKTVVLIECRRCNGCYFGGDSKVTLSPATEHDLPDEVSILVRKVGTCLSCKQHEDRTRGGQRKRFER